MTEWLERPTCDAQTTRGRCGATLYADGECPIARSHVADLQLPELPQKWQGPRREYPGIEYDEDASVRLLNAIFGVEGRYDSEEFDLEIQRWEAEGGAL